MKRLTKVSISYPRFSVGGQLLLMLVCLATALLGFWAYTVLADVPTTSIRAEGETLPELSASSEVTTLSVTATMGIDPVDTTVGVGQSFSINVVISDVENLGGFEFQLNYNDSDIVRVTEPYTDHVTLGPFLSSTGRSAYPLGPTICGPSCIMYGAYSTGSSAGPTGSGTLATITFDAVGLGTAPLSLQNVQITDPVGGQLVCDTQDGMVGVEAHITGTAVYLPIILNNY